MLTVQSIIRGMLSAIFLIAGMSKFVDSAGTRASLADFGVPGGLAPLLGRAMPAGEIACAIILVSAASQRWSALCPLILLIIFTCGILFALAHGKHPVCHCFGSLGRAPIDARTVTRNFVLIGLDALLFIDAGRVPIGSGESADHGTNVLNPLEVEIASALVVWSLAALWMTLKAYKAVGDHTDKLRIVTGVLGLGDPRAEVGLPRGHAAPRFQVANTAGETVTFDNFSGNDAGTLLIFVTPGCKMCDDLLSRIAEWQSVMDNLQIVPVSRGILELNREKAEKYRIRNMLIQSDREMTIAYRLHSVPSAVLIRQGQIASSTVVGVNEIISLVGAIADASRSSVGEVPRTFPKY